MNWINVDDELPDNELSILGIEDMYRSDNVIIGFKYKLNYYVNVAYMRSGDWYWLENNKKISNDFNVMKWMRLPDYDN